jgi:hypothetical protein
MCGSGCKCGERADAVSEPDLMRRMTATLGIEHLLVGGDRCAAADRCNGCSDKDACGDWLHAAARTGADHAPSFCRNADLFERLAAAPSGDDQPGESDGHVQIL